MFSLTRNIFNTYRSKSGSLSIISSKVFQIDNLNPTLKQHVCSSSTAPLEHEHQLMLDEVSKGDKEVEYKLKRLMLELELHRQEGQSIPDSQEMTSQHYTELLQLNSRSARQRYLQFLFKIARKHENRKKKKEEKALQLEEKRALIPPKNLPLEEFVHHYSLQHNNIFLRFRDSSINKMYNNRLMQAMQFDQKLILDCGYHEKMTRRENHNCAKQLMLLFGENRLHDVPYDLHYCNFDKDSCLGQSLVKHIPTLFDPEFPLNIHKQNYSDIFPKEKLIYLTPHCKEEMKEYDHDALYIVGAIVDKTNQEPLSMAKAKQEQIRMMKFPLDRYLLWTGGSGKSLTLNQVVAILLDVKKTGNWEYALRHVPRRKLAQTESNEIEKVKSELLKRQQQWSPKVRYDLDYMNVDRNLKNQSKKRYPVSRLFDRNFTEK